MVSFEEQKFKAHSFEKQSVKTYQENIEVFIFFDLVFSILGTGTKEMIKGEKCDCA